MFGLAYLLKNVDIRFFYKKKNLAVVVIDEVNISISFKPSKKLQILIIWTVFYHPEKKTKKLFFEENSNFELGMRRVFLNFHSPCSWAELTSIIFIGAKIFRVSTLMLTTQTGYY